MGTVKLHQLVCHSGRFASRRGSARTQWGTQRCRALVQLRPSPHRFYRLSPEGFWSQHLTLGSTQSNGQNTAPPKHSQKTDLHAMLTGCGVLLVPAALWRKWAHLAVDKYHKEQIKKLKIQSQLPHGNNICFKWEQLNELTFKTDVISFTGTQQRPCNSEREIIQQSPTAQLYSWQRTHLVIHI